MPEGAKVQLKDASAEPDEKHPILGNFVNIEMIRGLKNYRILTPKLEDVNRNTSSRSGNCYRQK